MPFLHRRLPGIVAAILMIGWAGCRETDPPPPHARDLGDERGALLPTAPVWKNPAIADGQADWQPFRDPADSPEPDKEAPGSGNDHQAGNLETEAEIREFIREYNEVVADGSIDEMIEYYVQEQAAMLKPVLKAVGDVAGIGRQIRSELESKLPDAAGRIAAASDSLLSSLTLELRVESITGVSDDEATATMVAGSLMPAYRFVVVDDEWFIEIPGADALPRIKQTLDLAQTTCSGLLDGLRSGETSPEDALQVLETIVLVTDTAGHPLDAGEANGAEDTPAPNEQGDAEAEGAEENGG